MVDRRSEWGHLRTSSEEAIARIEPGEWLVFPFSNGQPAHLIRELVAQKERFDPKVTICTSAAALGVFDHVEPEAAPYFRTLLIHPGRLQSAVADGRAEYLPVDNIELCRLLDQGRLRCDTALVQVTPPDRDGRCSLGLSVGPVRAILRVARRVIAQINPHIPRTTGESLIPITRFDAVVEAAEPLAVWEGGGRPPTDIEQAIAQNVAGLIEDGATLQVGIGSLADAVLAGVVGKRRLRIRSGLISDGVMKLAEADALEEGPQPSIHAGSVIGSQDLYRWMEDNPLVSMESTETLHHQAMADPKFTPINSALDVDLSGQVNVERLGRRLVGGVGGHLRFMAAAGDSPGGRAILALPSTSRDGSVSRIKAALGNTPIGTPRSLIHYVVTECGVADLQGRTLKEREEALLAVAHPDHREQLRHEAEALSR